MGFFTFGTGADAARQVKNSAMDMQGESWNLMKSYLSQVRGALDGYLSGNQGFDPKQLELLKSQLLNSVAKNYAGSNAAVKTAMARSGSSGGPMGGDAVRPIAALESGKADAATSGVAGIDISNLQQALQNKFNAAQILSGNAQGLSAPLGAFTGQLNNALNTYSHDVQSGFGGQFMSNLGSSLGSGLGKGFSNMAIGGLSKATSSSGGGQ